MSTLFSYSLFFFNDTATTEIYTLSLHDALPICQDDEIDRLNRDLFKLALEIGDDPDRREWAMHMMLVGRCIERIGDNAVDVGEQTAFVVTGLFREFEDASHPELSPPTASSPDRKSVV